MIQRFPSAIPELLVALQGSPMLLDRVSALPLPDQRRIAAGEPLKVVVTDDGKTTHRLVEPSRMNRFEIFQVFAKDHIRDDGEQVGFINSKSPPERRPRNGVVLDTKKGGIFVNGEFISRKTLAEFLAKLSQ